MGSLGAALILKSVWTVVDTVPCSIRETIDGETHDRRENSAADHPAARRNAQTRRPMYSLNASRGGNRRSDGTAEAEISGNLTVGSGDGTNFMAGTLARIASSQLLPDWVGKVLGTRIARIPLSQLEAEDKTPQPELIGEAGGFKNQSDVPS